MRDGTTHLAHKAEHAVDMETGAVIAVTLQAADEGDTTTIWETLAEAGQTVAKLIEREAETAPEAKPQVNPRGIEGVVADKGYDTGSAVQDRRGGGSKFTFPSRNGSRVSGTARRPSRRRCTAICGASGATTASGS
jgi:hypothetical protein